MTFAPTANLARFTPSLMSGEQLERLFVVRDPQLQAILERVESARTSRERNHSLLVGPRGAGKTHIVSLVAHRVRSAKVRLPLAWLPEDPWTIASYKHLLQAISGRLEPAGATVIKGDERVLEASLNEYAATHGPIVVLIENMDVVLNAIGSDGQQKFRHLLQASRSLLLVATSSTLDRAWSDQASPFYGFFTTTTLKPFNEDEATAMLVAIARERGDKDLAAFLETTVGRARIQAVTYLAGGQPRLWALLSSALTVELLDDLVGLLLTRFDDLTPYYQEQLGRLSGHQRLVVAELAELDRPASVKDLAERLDIPQRSLAKTMGELSSRGWIAPTESPVAKMLDARRTYYELSEPLARLAFQIKDAHGTPIRLIVDFLKFWFTPEELETSDNGPHHDYLQSALSAQRIDDGVLVVRRLNQIHDSALPSLTALEEVDDALTALASGDGEPLLQLRTPVRRAIEASIDRESMIRTRLRVHADAQIHTGDTQHPALDTWIHRARSLVTDTQHAADTSDAQLVLVRWLANAWQFAEAQAVLAAVDGPDSAQMLGTQVRLSDALAAAGQWRSALELEREIAATLKRTEGPRGPNSVVSKRRIARALRLLGDYTAELATESEIVTELVAGGAAKHEILVATGTQASTMVLLGQYADARALHAEVAEGLAELHGDHHPDAISSRAILANTLSSMGELDVADTLGQEALREAVAVLGTEHPTTLAIKDNVANNLRDLGDYSAAATLQREVVNTLTARFGPRHPETLASRGNLAGTLFVLGDAKQALEIQTFNAEALEESFGPDHPHTLIALGNLAISLRNLGEYRAAQTLEQRAADTFARNFGPDHPDTLTALASLANSLSASGDYQRAREIEEHVISARSRLLGADHPHTLLAQGNLVGTLRSLDELDAALELIVHNLEARTRVLGPDHPDTISAKRQLARTLRASGSLGAALEVGLEVVDAYSEKLEPQHPLTLAAKGDLAVTLRASGDLSAAHEMENGVLLAAAKRLGLRPMEAGPREGLYESLRALGDHQTASALGHRRP
jgi:tetratricopeptide (TPR) repeat protein/DNA-binding MarR family transcriptional regulator